MTASLYAHLHDEAERIRWRMEDIPWERLDRERATPALRELVRGIAYSELTTTTATARFLTDLSDDVELARWLSVWFYEETKHPEVLLRWLERVGVAVDDDFFRRGRATAPLMKSPMGTLVTNVISEMVASAGYAGLAAIAPEPVLAGIARSLAGDEARHAASFYVFAARRLERSERPDADRRDALKVLYLWFQHAERVQHPVNEFYQRTTRSPEGARALADLELDLTPPRARIFRAVGALVGLPLDGSSDLLDEIRRLDRTP
jgi:hypothetical protein